MNVSKKEVVMRTGFESNSKAQKLTPHSKMAAFKFRKDFGKPKEELKSALKKSIKTYGSDH